VQASGPLGRRRKFEGPGMPRLAPAARLQIIREDLKAKCVPASAVDAREGIESPAAACAKDPLSPNLGQYETEYSPQQPLEILQENLMQALSYRSVAQSDGSDSWVDISLDVVSDKASARHTPCMPNSPPGSPPLRSRLAIHARVCHTPPRGPSTPNARDLLDPMSLCETPDADSAVASVDQPPSPISQLWRPGSSSGPRWPGLPRLSWESDTPSTKSATLPAQSTQAVADSKRECIADGSQADALEVALDVALDAPCEALAALLPASSECSPCYPRAPAPTPSSCNLCSCGKPWCGRKSLFGTLAQGGEGGSGCFPSWSTVLVESVAEEHRIAMLVVTPKALRFFLGVQAVRHLELPDQPIAAGLAVAGLTAVTSAPSAASFPATSLAPESGVVDESVADMVETIFAVLAEVAHRPFPLEMLLVSTAFARLTGTGAAKDCSLPGTVNARHLEVESLLLKYTALSSRMALREELDRWLPRQEVYVGEQDASHHIEGPDDAGQSLSIETLAAFISTHAATTALVRDAFDGLPTVKEEHSDPAGSAAVALVPRRVVQKGIENALAPLLAGLPTAVAGNGRTATFAARHIARHAAALALRPHVQVGVDEITHEETECLGGQTMMPADPQAEACRWSSNAGGMNLVGPNDFAELFRRAASIARVCVMHLTGDTVRWRNCTAAPSPRIDLRHSLGGG